MTLKRICVFCGSSSGADPAFPAAAASMGRLLAEKNIGLVFGGGNIGMMGVLADAALEAGGQVIGVIPKALVEKELAHEGVTELKIVDTMHERKALMSDLADGFIALPGGYGTLDELFESLTWAQLGMHLKPCGLLNVNQYFSHLLEFVEHSVRQRFVKPQHRELILVSDSPEELLRKMAAFQAPPVKKWIDRENL